MPIAPTTTSRTIYVGEEPPPEPFPWDKVVLAGGAAVVVIVILKEVLSKK